VIAISCLGRPVSPRPAPFNVFRTVIALEGAGFTLALTGFLTVQIQLSQRLSINTVGTLAVSVLLYFFSPATGLRGGSPRPETPGLLPGHSAHEVAEQLAEYIAAGERKFERFYP
jgi:hypothetical protein